MLECAAVSKTIGDRRVLDDVSLEIASGEIVVLLGANGAGKSTLLHCCCGRLAVESGYIRIGGRDPRAQPRNRSALGFVPQGLALYSELSVEENLRCFGRLAGVRGEILRERVARSLDWSGLAERAASRVHTLSGGMQRRLNIAASLLHDPQVLLLDEPMVGVDMASRNRIEELLRGLRDDGMAILLTTHDFPQAERLADALVYLRAGQVLVRGRPVDLVRSAFGLSKELLVTLADAPTPSFADRLKALDLVPGSDERIWSGTAADHDEIAAWTRRLDAASVEPASVSVREASLEGALARLEGAAA